MALSSLVTVGLPILNYFTNLFFGEKSRGQNWDIARFNVEQQARLEASRQQMQVAQMKLNYLQQAENRAFQAEQTERNLAYQTHQAERNRAFQSEQARLSREHQAELECFRQQVQQEISERNLQFQSWKLSKEQELQRELANYNRETQQLIAAFQRETALKLPEVNKLYEAWPLRIVPLQILNHQPNGVNPPLKVIIAPPEVDSDKFGATVAGVPTLEKGLAEGLRNFFGKYYPLEHAQRPVEFLGGAWDAKRFHGESSIKALFSMLNSEALLVLESEIDGDYLNMRFAYWAPGQARYSYAPVLTRFLYRESVYESAKARAQKWEKPHDLLLQQGKNPKLLNEIDTHNLEVLRENEQLKEFGVDISQLPSRYKLRTEDFEPLNQFLVLHHSLVAGLLADVHHLLQHDVPPVLPQWLQAFIAQGVSAELLQSVVDTFRQVLQEMATERPAWAADLSVELATSLASLPDKTWAQAVLGDALQYWLNSRGETVIPDGLAARITAVCAVLTVADTAYAQKLQSCLNLLDGQTHMLALQQRQTRLAEETRRKAKAERQARLAEEAQRKAEAERQARLAEETRRKAEAERQARLAKEAQRKAEAERQARLAEEARRKAEAERQARLAEEAQRKAEAERQALEAKFNPIWASNAGQDRYGRYADLNVDGVVQRFRWIEAGTFLMGSPLFEPERNDDEVQHQVRLTKDYWLADTACTQALWQAVLGSNPAYFQDNINNPVEQVSWNDVQYFLQTLNQGVSGLWARLPTEAEWEYVRHAGRAWINTPYSCGDNITTQQANFGNSVGKTVPVTSFAPNVRGLYQMPGNVWEWCQDWYGDYPTQAVTDPQGVALGSARVVRGGSWRGSGIYCRSAFRSGFVPDTHSSSIGFRFVVSS